MHWQNMMAHNTGPQSRSNPLSGTTTHDGPKSAAELRSEPARHPESDVLDRISALVDEQMHGGEDVAHWRAENHYPLDDDGNCACPVCKGMPIRPDLGIDGCSYSLPDLLANMHVIVDQIIGVTLSISTTPIPEWSSLSAGEDEDEAT
jgi:hypothetical protein